jgi:hypothetical protein
MGCAKRQCVHSRPRRIEYRANFVALPDIETAVWDALACGKTDVELLQAAIALGAKAFQRKFAFVNKLAEALQETGALLNALENPDIHLTPTGQEERLGAAVIDAKVVTGEFCGGKGVGQLLSQGEVVVCNTSAGPDRRVWRALQPNTIVLLTVGPAREGVYEGASMAETTEAYTRKSYEEQSL